MRKYTRFASWNVAYSLSMKGWSNSSKIYQRDAPDSRGTGGGRGSLMRSEILRQQDPLTSEIQWLRLLRKILAARWVFVQRQADLVTFATHGETIGVLYVYRLNQSSAPARLVSLIIGVLFRRTFFSSLMCWTCPPSTIARLLNDLRAKWPPSIALSFLRTIVTCPKLPCPRKAFPRPQRFTDVKQTFREGDFERSRAIAP